MPLSRKLLYAALLLLLTLGALEGLARVLVRVAPPLAGSRGDQYRDFLVTFDVDPAVMDRLLRNDPRLFWSFRPNVPDLAIRHRRGLWKDVATNARGLRDDPLAVPKPTGLVRVLCVGDSCTYGTGVRREDSIPGVLDARLGDDVDVVNAGVPGYTAFQATRYLEERGLRLEPDVVVFTLGFNDARSWDGLSDAEHAKRLEARTSGLSALASRSRAVRIVRQYLKRVDGTMATSATRAERSTKRVPVDEYVALLARAGELARGSGARILYVLWPVASTVGSGRRSAHQQALVAFCERTGAELVDPTPALAADPEGIFLFDDVHMTPKGYRIVAERIAARLERLGWLEPAAP